MELPLQQLDKKGYKVRFDCFNPCFNGTTSATENVGIKKIVDLKFQSLF